MVAGGTALPVTCSNLGDLPPRKNRRDGTDADYVNMRNLEPDMKKSTLEGIAGQLPPGFGARPREDLYHDHWISSRPAKY